MDPDATVRLLLDAMADHDHAAVGAAASDLLGWLDGGGYVPPVVAHLDRDDVVVAARYLARAWDVSEDLRHV